MNSRHFWSVALVVASLSVAGCKSMGDKTVIPAMVTVPAAGEHVTIQEVVVVVDASGSMWPGTSFAYAKALATSMVHAFPDGSYRAGLLSFGGEWTFEWTDYAPYPLDRPKLNAAAYDLRFIAGSTPLNEALVYVDDTYFNTNTNRALIILSDGKTDPQPLLDNAVAMSYGGHLCIHTVQVGDDDGGGRLLADLAAITPCGSFRHADTIASDTAMNEFIRDVFFQDLAIIEVIEPDGSRSVLGTVYFDTDKSFIRSEHDAMLAGIAEQVKAVDDLFLCIQGNADARASDEYNRALSMRRAQAVVDRLRSLGVGKDHLFPMALGEESPVVPNTSPANMQLNRRVDLIVIK